EPGSPEVNWKGQLAVVSIVPKLVLNHDVTLETGNIHFVGQIELHGSVQDGMAVDANENLTVYGNVNRAKVTAGQSIIVHNNIIGSDVTAGQAKLSAMELSRMLKEMIVTMKQMEIAIEQLGKVSAN